MKYFLLFILHAGSFGHFFGLLFVAGFWGTKVMHYLTWRRTRGDKE